MSLSIRTVQPIFALGYEVWFTERYEGIVDVYPGQLG